MTDRETTVSSEDRRAAWVFAVGRPGQYGMNRVQSSDPAAWIETGVADLHMLMCVDGHRELERTAEAFAQHRQRAASLARTVPTNPGATAERKD